LRGNRFRSFLNIVVNFEFLKTQFQPSQIVFKCFGGL
jgi:hypothetical protein